MPRPRLEVQVPKNFNIECPDALATASGSARCCTFKLIARKPNRGIATAAHQTAKPKRMRLMSFKAKRIRLFDQLQQRLSFLNDIGRKFRCVAAADVLYLV